MTTEATSLIEFHTENVKGVRAISIRLEGNVTVIEGKNGSGKTSAIDSIWYALAGAGVHPPEVLRHGAEKGLTRLNFGEFVVERKYTPKGTSLLVTMKDGTKVASPQTFLDGLDAQELAFDPGRFFALDRKKQVALVQRLVGFNPAELDAKRQLLTDQKSATNAKGSSLSERIKAMPVPGPETPDELVSIAALLDEQAKHQGQKDANDQVRANLIALQQKRDVASTVQRNNEHDVERLEAELASARVAAVASAQALGEARAAVDVAAAAVEKLVEPDIADVYRRIRGAEATNQAVRAKAERATLSAELDELRIRRDKLTSDLDRLDSDRREMLRSAKFPIDGLGFGLDGLTFDVEGRGEVPLEQLNEALRLRVVMAIGLAMSPKLRLVLIRNGSQLDNEGLAIVGRMAAEKNAHVIVERVREEPGAGFFIVDGELVDKTETPLGPKRDFMRIVDAAS